MLPKTPLEHFASNLKTNTKPLMTYETITATIPKEMLHTDARVSLTGPYYHVNYAKTADIVDK
jgi:hypothetical protein